MTSSRKPEVNNASRRRQRRTEPRPRATFTKNLPKKRKYVDDADSFLLHVEVVDDDTDEEVERKE